MATATVNSRGQITIPAEVRAALRQSQVDRVVFVELEGGQFTMVADTQPVQRLKGMIDKPKTAVTTQDINKAAAHRPSKYTQVRHADQKVKRAVLCQIKPPVSEYTNRVTAISPSKHTDLPLIVHLGEIKRLS